MDLLSFNRDIWYLVRWNHNERFVKVQYVDFQQGSEDAEWFDRLRSYANYTTLLVYFKIYPESTSLADAVLF